jgi:predicted nucleic acid-binding protein
MARWLQRRSEEVDDAGDDVLVCFGRQRPGLPNDDRFGRSEQLARSGEAVAVQATDRRRARRYRNRSRIAVGVTRDLAQDPVWSASVVETWARMEQWIGQATDGGERFGVMDLLVASIATDQEAPLWSLDRDFRRMARLGFLELYRPE